jgi:hypothetical protein
LTQDAFLMLVRMALQMAGTFLVAHGVFGETDWTTFAGALLTIAPIGWSFWARREAGLKASVSAIPNTMVATVTPGTEVAVASKFAAINEVKTVLSTPAVAAAAPSEKVVAP